MKTRGFIYLLCAFITVGTAGMSAGQGEDPREVKAEIKKIALFKNGCGFTTLSLPVEDKDKDVIVKDLPFAIHGTLWFETKGDSVVGMLSRENFKSQKTTYKVNPFELAKANPGRQVFITTDDGKNYTGTIEKLGGSDDGEESADYVDTSNYAYGNAWRSPGYQSGFICIKGERGPVLLREDKIVSVNFLEPNDLKPITYTKNESLLKLRMAKASAKDPVRVTCIAPGISWMPSYKFDLGEGGQGKFSIQAEIINELADINNAELELISGYPNVEFGNALSPISRTQSLADFFRSLDNQGGKRMLIMDNSAPVAAQGYAMNSGFASGGLRSGDGSISSMAVPGAIDDAVSEGDLFFYPVQSFSCKKGDTALIPILSGDLPFEHIMTWDVSGSKAYRDSSADRDKEPNDVWHCIRITNNLKMPLTTAPIEFTSGGKYIGQSMITFTPAGGTNFAKINKAMDVLAEREERIVSQERVDVMGTTKMKISVEGKLFISNKKTTPIVMQVTKSLTGIADTASDNGKVSQVRTFIRDYNPDSSIKWEITIQPNETKELTYTYNYLY